MQDAIVQPNASRIPEALVSAILRHTPGARVLSPSALIHHHEFANDLAEVRLDHGRRLIVERGRYSWSLAELWPDLGAAERRGAMVSLGGLIWRLHDLGTAGHGELTTALECAHAGHVATAARAAAAGLPSLRGEMAEWR